MNDPERLVPEWLDGELSDDDQAALRQWLAADDDHVRRFAEALLFEQQIRSAVVAGEQRAAFVGSASRGGAEGAAAGPAGEAGRDDRHGEVGRTRGFRRGLFVVLCGVAAVGAVVVAAVGHRSLPETVEPPPAIGESRGAEEESLPVARGFCRLTDASSAGWEAGRSLQVGDRVGAGRIGLASGTAAFTWDNGVRAICSGPADLELRDEMHVWLHAGQVVFRVPPAAIGFTVETTEAMIVDLGTEFGVRTDGAASRGTGDGSGGAGRGTELQVYEGEVVAGVKPGKADANSARTRVLGGQALRIASGPDGAIQPLPFRPERFVHEMPDPKDHPEAVGKPFPKKSPYNKPRHDAIRVLPAPAGIEVDGSLADWNLSGEFAGECPPPWSEFYHVRGALMYDREFLYVGGTVADPFPMRSTASPTPDRELYGGGGSVVLRISADRKIGWPVRARVRAVRADGCEYLPEDRNERLASLVMWYYAAESRPCLDVRYGMDHHGRRLNPPGFRGAWRKHADGMGYTVEYAIPWTLLNAADDPPRAGDTLACTWLVHWSDPTGRNWRGQLIEIVNPQEKGWNFQNAGTWGRAVYQSARTGD